MAQQIEQEVEILLVEDDPIDEELTLRSLKQHNLSNRIHVARDGAQALDFIFSRGKYADRAGVDAPKLVLLDLKLPLVDGIEVLREMKQDEKARMIPVVVLTSSREERDIVESYKLGVNSYIVKPVDFDQFAGSVKEIGMYWMLYNIAPTVR